MTEERKTRGAQSGCAGLYLRLSKDDERAGESLSIENQRRILQEYAREHGLTVFGEYVDDGYSGTDFERPAVKRLLEDAKEGRIGTVLVKDLSRFGRNYIQVGQYLDYVFPAYGVRFIALSDRVDTADRSSSAMDMMPIVNVFNEWHAANTSKKIRAVFEASRRAGKYTSWSYPYGYRAGNDQKRTAVIDEEAAAVVRRIYGLRLAGNSAGRIARILSDEGIPNPATYYKRRGGGTGSRNCSPLWPPKTVRQILSDPTYLGRTVQHRTARISYKNHKTVALPPSEWIVTENAHPPIVSREIWDRVQESFSSSRGRADKRGEVHPLSGLVVCPDCGKKLKLKRAKGGNCFVCRTYADLGKGYCSSHRISEETLERLVLNDLRALAAGAEIDENKARESFLRERAKGQDGRDERLISAYQNRLAELEKLLQSAFEEKVLGNLPESVLAELCEKYRAERETVLKAKREAEQRQAARDADGDAEEYVRKLKRYAAGDSLTRELCLRLICKIVVGSSDAPVREIAIFYKATHTE